MKPTRPLGDRSLSLQGSEFNWGFSHALRKIPIAPEPPLERGHPAAAWVVGEGNEAIAWYQKYLVADTGAAYRHQTPILIRRLRKEAADIALSASSPSDYLKPGAGEHTSHWPRPVTGGPSACYIRINQRSIPITPLTSARRYRFPGVCIPAAQPE